MAKCPFCHGFRDDTYECECFAEWQSDRQAGRCPEGMIPEAFEYRIWRRVRQLEQNLQLHPEKEPEVHELLANLITKANAEYQKVQENITAIEQRKQKLAGSPRPRLY